MPLSHGKSAKAFSHNVETEMHHGKPLKQSLAIAYAMKRKKKAHGGEAECYAKGGDVKGVHPKSHYSKKGGVSHAGAALRQEKHEKEMGRPSEGKDIKGEHELVLGEMKRMKDKDRKYLADGGTVEEGFRKAFRTPDAIKAAPKPMPMPAKPKPFYQRNLPDSEKGKVMSEAFMKAEGGSVGCKNCGYAEGGDVMPSYDDSPETMAKKHSEMTKNVYGMPSASDSPETLSKKHKQMSDHLKSRPAPKFAKGGEVEKDYEAMEEASGYDDFPDVEDKYNPKAEDDAQRARDLVEHIMEKRMGRYSKGGQVANDVGEGMDVDEEPNQFDDLVKEDNLEFHYTGKNSGDEIGNEQEDEDRHDVVKQIMMSRKKKDKMPRPA